MERPLNILPDLGVLLGAVAVLIGIGRATSTTLDTLFGPTMACLYLASIARITRKAVRAKLEMRLGVSAFSYGFFFGCSMWLLFVLSEWKGGGISEILSAGLFVVIVGIVAGLVAVLLSSTVRGLLTQEPG